MPKKTIFITGTTGSMGSAALLELLERRDRFEIVTLVRPSRKNKRLMSRYRGEPGFEILWGDLRCYEDVLRGVTGADYVLNPAAVISPAAERDPDTAWATNVGAAEHIVKAIKAQPDPDAIKFVSIGSVATIGDRLPPIHVGRVGDPLKPSIYDPYAVSKIAAERIVIESGLRHWVSLRQTFIALPNLLSLLDPIMYHQPFDTRVEFVTAADSGRLLANVCEADVPEGFWRRVYNVGGGPACRVIFDDYAEVVFRGLGLGSPRALFERNWFALQNFLCHWFEDSDVLEGHLRFRRETLEDHLRQVSERSPWYVKLVSPPGVGRLIPKRLVKELVMKPLARSRNGPLHWIENGVEGRITAFFGSLENWGRIPDWDADGPERDLGPFRLDHGYDEDKPESQLDLDDMRGAAVFRGGECLSKEMSKGDLSSKLRWRCAFGHEFDASPTLVLLAGHWCPTCAPPPWNYDEIAKVNPFFAQAWYPNHDPSESNFYDERCFESIL
jgi:nucleoside-diphosphate-sugar epimerase